MISEFTKTSMKTKFLFKTEFSKVDSQQ